MKKFKVFLGITGLTAIALIFGSCGGSKMDSAGQAATVATVSNSLMFGEASSNMSSLDTLSIDESYTASPVSCYTLDYTESGNITLTIEANNLSSMKMIFDFNNCIAYDTVCGGTHEMTLNGEPYVEISDISSNYSSFTMKMKGSLSVTGFITGTCTWNATINVDTDDYLGDYDSDTNNPCGSVPEFSGEMCGYTRSELIAICTNSTSFCENPTVSEL